MIIAPRQLDELCLYKIIFNLDRPKRAVLGFCFACETKPNFRRHSNQILTPKNVSSLLTNLRTAKSILEWSRKGVAINSWKLPTATNRDKIVLLSASSQRAGFVCWRSKWGHNELLWWSVAFFQWPCALVHLLRRKLTTPHFRVASISLSKKLEFKSHCSTCLTKPNLTHAGKRIINDENAWWKFGVCIMEEPLLRNLHMAFCI